MSATIVVTEVETENEQYIPENIVIGHQADEEEEEEDGVREAELIVFENCSKGLGIKICGGCSEDEDFGIFVKRILPNGLADHDGRLQEGDQLLEVNKESLEGVTNERAVAVLRQASASNHVEMVVTRDEQARGEFLEVLDILNGYSFTCTPIPTELQSKASSRATTPSIHGDSLKRSGHKSDEKSPRSSPYDASSLSPRYHSAEEEPGRSQENLIHNGKVDTLQSGPTFTDDSPHQQVRAPRAASTPHVGGNNDSSSLMGSLEPSPVPVVGETTASNGTSASSVFNMHSLSNLPKSRNMSQSRKLSLDPYVRIRVEKLEVALRYLGLEPTPEQHMELRNRLSVDASGTVHYGDFVAVARELFRLQLEERNIGASAMYFAANDLTDFVEPPAFKLEMGEIPNVEDFQTVKQERDDLRQEVAKLKLMLKEKEQSCNMAEDELSRIRQEAQGAIHESRSLRSKVHLAEQAQRAARNMEQDYDEVVRLLEGEIMQLKVQLSKQQGDMSPAVQKRLAVLACQLRKAEAGKKTYEVATEKLLQLAEHVHETLSSQTNGLGGRPLSNPGESARGNLPPGYLGKHKKQSNKTLATEAREMVKAVRSLIETEPLGFGWEEAYTADGMKYYINHLTQVTTWSHPKSSVQHLPTIQEDKKSKQTEPKSAS